MLGLTPPQLRELRDALLDAFPSRPKLEQMLFFHLGKNLRDIVDTNGLQDSVFMLMQQAVAEGWLLSLIRAAHEANPNNPRLLAFLSGEFVRELVKNTEPDTFSLNLLYDLLPPSTEIPAHLTNPCQILRGTRLVLRYEIMSKLDLPIPVWLGADLTQEERYFYDVREDMAAVLLPGSHAYHRFLTVAVTLLSGDYLLNAAVWYGPRSHTEQSFTLAPAWGSVNALHIS
jgi:hypothetical protein